MKKKSFEVGWRSFEIEGGGVEGGHVKLKKSKKLFFNITFGQILHFSWLNLISFVP